LGVALALAGVFGVLLPILGIVGTIDPVNTREVETEAAARVPDAVASGPVTLGGTRQAEVAFAEPDLPQRMLLALPEVAGSLLLALVLFLLLRIAGTLRAGDVFVPRNARRLLAIAVATVAIGLLGPLVEAITTQLLVADTAVAEAVPFVYTVSTAPLLLGVLIAALAEAFRQGTRLRADTEGLV
ncbi:DUF2975 domain-containing protein, partial [Streptomyces durbertensis]